MRRLFVPIGSVCVVLFAAAGVFAQERLDLAGTWVLDPATAPITPLGTPASGPFGVEFTARQDANSLTVVYTQGALTLTETFRLDGSESRNPPPVSAVDDWVSKAGWEGTRLVIESELRFPDNTIASRRVLWLEDGHLVVEASAPSALGSARSTRRVIYRKH